jgi:hypothetical protein
MAAKTGLEHRKGWLIYGSKDRTRKLKGWLIHGSKDRTRTSEAGYL